MKLDQRIQHERQAKTDEREENPHVPLKLVPDSCGEVYLPAESRQPIKAIMGRGG